MITLSDQDLAALRKWMHEELGLRGDDYRPTFLARRIGPRLSAAGFTDVGTYLAFPGKTPRRRKRSRLNSSCPRASSSETPRSFNLSADCCPRGLACWLGRR